MYATVLWFLLFVFCLRVAGQALVAAFAVPFLPPMKQWYSGSSPTRSCFPCRSSTSACSRRWRRISRGGADSSSCRGGAWDGCSSGSAISTGARWRSDTWRAWHYIPNAAGSGEPFRSSFTVYSRPSFSWWAATTRGPRSLPPPFPRDDRARRRPHRLRARDRVRPLHLSGPASRARSLLRVGRRRVARWRYGPRLLPGRPNVGERGPLAHHLDRDRRHGGERLGDRREGVVPRAHGAAHHQRRRRGVCGLLRPHVVHHPGFPRGGGFLSAGHRVLVGRVVRRVCTRAGAAHPGRDCRARPHVHRSRGATGEDRAAPHLLQSQRAVPSHSGGGPVALLSWLAEAPC